MPHLSRDDWGSREPDVEHCMRVRISLQPNMLHYVVPFGLINDRLIVMLGSATYGETDLRITFT